MPKLKYAVTCILLLLSLPFSAAQDDDHAPVELPNAEATSFAAHLAEKRIAFSVAFAQKSWDDYRIAVLGRDGLARLSLPDALILEDAEALSDWLNAGRPDALLILPDALDWLDPADVQTAYRGGTGILTSGLTFAQHAELTGDACTLPDIEADEPQPALIASVWVLINGEALDDAQREVVYETGLVACDSGKTERLSDQPWGVHTGYHLEPSYREGATSALLLEFAASRSYQVGAFEVQQTALAEWRLTTP